MNTTARPEIPAPPRYSAKNPFAARLLRKQRLTLPGSEKETIHYELSLAGSGLTHEPGDSLAILPANDPSLVEDLLAQFQLDGSEQVAMTGGEAEPLRNVLLRHRTITKPSGAFLEALGRKAKRADSLRALLEPGKRSELQDYLWGRDLLDLAREHPEVQGQFEPQELARVLAPLQPRLYSIASSLLAYPEAAHLLVVTVRYHSQGRLREGVCTGYLSRRVDERSCLPVFVHSARHFRLPADPDTPLIMVGHGTGLAPYRAFLQERQARGARGPNWLFFGEQHRRTEFFYEREWEHFQAAGLLARLDTAFSRDQPHKIYVQHRLMEQARDVWAWLEEGACFYVCGDARRMAPDVDAALHSITQSAGGLSEENARQYIAQLKRQKRYLRDVY